MDYSQKPLIELMKEGEFPDETGRPKHIETVISNVFIFDKNVYKFYKNDNDFFNKGFRDISGKLERFDFTRRDFEWNRDLSPQIYLKLMGVKLQDGKIVIDESREKAEELLIFMNRVETGNVLFEKLLRGEISEAASFSMGQQLAENLARVEVPLTNKHNYYEIFGTRIADLRNFIKPASEYIGEDESGTYCDFLETFRKDNREWFENKLSNELTYGGDMHSHNAVFSNGSLYLMDTFPPKEIWRIEHRLVPLYRMGVDLWALSGNKNLFESFVRGYEKTSGAKIDRKLDTMFVIWASAIMVSYLYMLQRTDPSKKESAQKFHKFIRDYFVTIN